jgi:hypothetical protein
MPSAQLTYVFNVATCSDLKGSSSGQRYKIRTYNQIHEIIITFINEIAILNIFKIRVEPLIYIKYEYH